MVEGREQTERNENQREIIQVLGTNRDNPDEGRIFVWTKRGWFERVKGTSGGVAFAHIAGSEEEVRKYIARDNPSAELVELEAKYQRRVIVEFSARSQSYRDSSQDWRAEATDEDENQQYHQHK